MGFSTLLLMRSLVAAVTFALSAATAACAVEYRTVALLPQFVYDYAPLVWLHSQETYLPSDLGQHLLHTTPKVNFATVAGFPTPLTLDNLDSLNSLNGSNVFLTSNDDITKNPAWLHGVAPDASGKTNDAVSSVIVVLDKGNGMTDAFYFYFYAYNQGNKVFGIEFGDHVGDWEHNMIRFKNSVPQAIWYSQHANGEAFTYNAVEKQGKRPIAYSGNGTHANFAIAGLHDHVIPDVNLPAGFLVDYTDKGKLWDPTLSAYSYGYDAKTMTFIPAAESYNPVGFMNFIGKWGDQQYPVSDPRQYILFGQAKYSGGPTGPRDKQLNRTNICPDNGIACILRPIKGP